MNSRNNGLAAFSVQKSKKTTRVHTLPDSTKVLLEEAPSDETARLQKFEELHRIIDSSDLFLKLQDRIQDQNGVPYFAYEHCPGGTLEYQMRLMRTGRKEIWETDTVVRYIIIMTTAVRFLHQHLFLHCKISPQHFYLTENQKLKLGHFSDTIPITNAETFEIWRKLEMEWLGSIFIAMVTLKPFLELYSLPPVAQIGISLRDRQVAGDQIQSMIEAMFTDSQNLSFLKTPEVVSRTAIFVKSQISMSPPISNPPVNDSLSLVRMQSTSITARCITCPAPFKVACPCGHSYCGNCFSNYIETTVSQDSFTPANLVCQVCCSLLATDFVFLNLSQDAKITEKLDKALIICDLIHCPYCQSVQDEFPEGEAKRIKCGKCRKKFCSKCRKKPHFIGSCPLSHISNS